MSSNPFKIKRAIFLDNSFQYKVEIDPSHSVFVGHFPQKPVVPGVCTMEMLKSCLSDIFSRPIRYDFIKECKFLSAIVPNEHKMLDVKIDIKHNEESIDIVAEVLSEGTKMMKLRATIK